MPDNPQDRLIRSDNADDTYYPDTHTFDTENKDWISRITHKAQYRPNCCEGWRHSGKKYVNRKYFYVLDNGIEWNTPHLWPYTAVCINTSLSSICVCTGCTNLTMSLFFTWAGCGLIALKIGCCDFIPPNCICPVEDHVSKIYFDDWCFSREHIGCTEISGPAFVGAPKAFKLNDHLTCCCMSPTVCGLNFWCGDMVAIEPFQSFYSTDAKTMFLCNCCGLCGLKSGSPLCCIPVTCKLREKEGDMLTDAINNSYAKWATRTRNLRDQTVDEQPRAPSECPYEPTRVFSTDNQTFELKEMKT